jgi:ABC-type Fe3+-hydroxamate transport system substrate-binding protein
LGDKLNQRGDLIVAFKRAFALIAFALLILTACSTATPSNSSSTNDNWQDFADNTPVQIDDAILQACYSYSKALGYDIEKKEEYRSVLLGESNISSVLLDDDTDADMVDENDYLVIFQEIRAVIDADTGITLGRIPYV